MTTSTPPLFWADDPSVLYRPSPSLVGESILLRRCEFCNEVCQSLHFDGCSRMVLNVKLAEFNRPLDHSSGCFRLLHGFLDRLVRHYQDRICMEILSQFV